MKKLLLSIIVCCCSQFLYGQSSRFSSLEIVKAADMVLDVNDFVKAHTVLAMNGLPVNEKATDEFAKQFSKDWFEYQQYVATNAYIYWPEYQKNPGDMLIGRLTAYSRNESDIKELHLTLGETYRTKFLSDLPMNGYMKIKSENKKDKDFGVSFLETLYQKDNHLCTVKTFATNSNLIILFTHKDRTESAEDKKIAEQCKRFIWLNSIDGVRPYNLTDKNAPYEIPADIDIQFPSENTAVNITTDVLSNNPERVVKSFEVNISSAGGTSIDSYEDKEKAFFNWIKPYINVKSTAKVNFPRYGKGFVVGDSFSLSIHESEELDSCTVSFKVKYKSSDEFIIKNQKEVEAKLTSVYGSPEMLNSIWMSFPKTEMARAMYFIGYTYIVKVHVCRRKVTYEYNDKSATYTLPFAYIWGEPVKK